LKNELKIITVVTNKNEDGLIHLLMPSSSFFNLNLTILEIQPENYHNHRCKDSILYEYLKTVANEEMIFFTDGYDAMFVCPEKEILTKYYKTGKEIIFSAEINCWPDINLADRYPKTESPFKYLCSGGYIGKAGYIKKKIEEKLETESIQKYPFSNQVYWTEQFLRDQENIGLDSECQIFLALSSEIDMLFIKQPENEENFNKYLEQKVNWFNKHFSFKKNRVYNKMTKAFPCHVHTNGLSKLIAKEIADTLNFKD
jgi:hypothetical protein